MVRMLDKSGAGGVVMSVKDAVCSFFCTLKLKPEPRLFDRPLGFRRCCFVERTQRPSNKSSRRKSSKQFPEGLVWLFQTREFACSERSHSLLFNDMTFIAPGLSCPPSCTALVKRYILTEVMVRVQVLSALPVYILTVGKEIIEVRPNQLRSSKDCVLSFSREARRLYHRFVLASVPNRSGTNDPTSRIHDTNCAFPQRQRWDCSFLERRKLRWRSSRNNQVVPRRYHLWSGASRLEYQVTLLSLLVPHPD